MASMSLALGHCKQEDVNCQTRQEDGRTPLHVAAARGNTTMVQMIIWYQGNMNTLDKNGETPLYSARMSGNMDVLALLTAAGTSASG
eukprot:GFUD01090945.1.p1 GENE.GFUD01090945.1~~GFUD01090945.1.p1  ORF type:complete len:100 (-),score=31.15 GFUD01090945.1:72-332(-)